MVPPPGSFYEQLCLQCLSTALARAHFHRTCWTHHLLHHCTKRYRQERFLTHPPPHAFFAPLLRTTSHFTPLASKATGSAPQGQIQAEQKALGGTDPQGFLLYGSLDKSYHTISG